MQGFITFSFVTVIQNRMTLPVMRKSSQKTYYQHLQGGQCDLTARLRFYAMQVTDIQLIACNVTETARV